MPRPARIDRLTILRAALEVADREGVAALTMQRVAGQLAVSPMGLYRHVQSKADLLDGVVELLLGEIAVPPGDTGWQHQLATIAQNVRDCARRHPSVFRLLLERPAATPGSQHVRDTIYAALAAAGLPAHALPQAERLISTMVLGFCVSEVSDRFALPAATLDADFACIQDTILDVLSRQVTSPAQPSHGK